MLINQLTIFAPSPHHLVCIIQINPNIYNVFNNNPPQPPLRRLRLLLRGLFLHSLLQPLPAAGPGMTFSYRN